MDAILQSQLTRIETALNTLLESITSYNPSPAAAAELVAADEQFCLGLELCTFESCLFLLQVLVFSRLVSSILAIIVLSSSPTPPVSSTLFPISLRLTLPSPVSTHQTNHTRIQHLRAAVHATEAQLKSAVATLASTRAELISETPAADDDHDTDTDDDHVHDKNNDRKAAARPVPLDELLAYAKRISKFSVPPSVGAGAERGGVEEPGKGEGAMEVETQAEGVRVKEEKEPEAMNGVAQNGGSGVVAGEQSYHQSQPQPQQPQNQPPSGRAVSSLTDVERKWQAQAASLPFVPWPSEDLIRSSGLAEIQSLLEQGRDLTAEVGRAEEERRAREREEEEARRRAEEQEEEERQRRRRRESVQGVAGGQRGVAREDVFAGLDLYEPDEA